LGIKGSNGDRYLYANFQVDAGESPPSQRLLRDHLRVNGHIMMRGSLLVALRRFAMVLCCDCLI
jgi:hypothetical protein